MADAKQPQFSLKPPGKPVEKETREPARFVRAIRLGNNKYRIVEETYAGQPTTVRTIANDVSRVPAEDEVRLWYETFLGSNRFGDSGL